MREGFCLRSENENDRIALRGVRVCSVVRGMSQKTTVEQTFVNREARAIEAVYTFPLPPEAAVCQFEVITGDRILTGRIEEREQAIETYEDAINKGDGGFLLEQERPDIFTVRVGNLKPGQAATINLTYIGPLEVVDNSIRLTFPATVAPRYVTDTASDPLQAIIDGDAINPPTVTHVPYGLSMEIDIDLGRKVKAISSTSHAIATQDIDERKCRVTFVGTVAQMDRDVVVQVEMAGEQEPCAQMAVSPDGAKYLALSFLPEFDDALTPRKSQDVMFVIDCSGSMQGESIAQACTALELCLRSMSIGDRFNICRFGNRFEFMNPEPLVYSEATLAQAVQYLSRVRADLGGTEIFAPLMTIFGTASSCAVRQVILLTDGQISNDDAVLALVKQNRRNNRIFSFGIGAAPSAHLICGMARMSGGASEFISDGENIADKVLRTFARISSPSLSDAVIDWGDCEVAVAPMELPPIFDGDAFTVFARVSGNLPRKISLRATAEDGIRTWTIALPENSGDDGVIATAWARKMIQSLEEREMPLSEKKARLLSISQTFGLVCSMTAFVAVEHRSIEERNNGRPVLRRVPVMLAKGWGGSVLSRGAMGGAAFCAAAPAPAQARPAAYSGALKPQRRRFFDFGKKMAKRAPIAKAMEGSLLATENQHASAEVESSALLKLLSLQSAEGFFNASAYFEKQLDFVGGKDALEKAVRTRLPQSVLDARDRIETTVMMLVLLRVQFGADEGIWRASSEKAFGYLAAGLAKPVAEVKKWLEELALSQGKVKVT